MSKYVLGLLDMTVRRTVRYIAFGNRYFIRYPSFWFGQKLLLL
jgi:hypothetical protein